MLQYRSAGGSPFTYLVVYILSQLAALRGQSHSTPSSLILLSFYPYPFTSPLNFKKINTYLCPLHLLPL